MVHNSPTAPIIKKSAAKRQPPRLASIGNLLSPVTINLQTHHARNHPPHFHGSADCKCVVFLCVPHLSHMSKMDTHPVHITNITEATQLSLARHHHRASSHESYLSPYTTQVATLDSWRPLSNSMFPTTRWGHQ